MRGAAKWKPQCCNNSLPEIFKIGQCENKSKIALKRLYEFGDKRRINSCNLCLIIPELNL